MIRGRFLVAIFCLASAATACMLSAQEPAPAPAAAGTAAPAAAPLQSASAPANQAAGGDHSTTAPASSAATATTGAGAAATTSTAKQVPLPDRPYRVNVQIGFRGPMTSLASFRKKTVSAIRSGFTRMYGPMWNATVEDSAWFVPADRWRMERMTVENMARYTDETTDKVLLIAIEDLEAGYQITCREFDTKVQEYSPVLSEKVGTASGVADKAVELSRDSFRPFLLFANPGVDKSKGELEFLLQAGNLIPPDPSAAQIAEGDVLRTFLRQMDRRDPKKVKILQKLDLCYIRVTAFNEILGTAELKDEDAGVTVAGAVTTPSNSYIDTGHVRGLLLAHGPVPFGGKSRNLQQIGLRQRPVASKSRVRMVLQNREDRPLICARVDIVQKLRQTDVSDIPARRVLTGRDGDLHLEVDPKNPTFWLYVYSGSILLARVPYAPGLIQEEVMKLPDDSLRLGVEGELYLMRDELVDMVAEKAVYMSIAKKTSEAKDGEGFKQVLGQLSALPAKEYFQLRLNETRAPAVEKATRTKNAGAKRRIEQLCTKMGDSINTFFSSERILKDATELSKLRQAAGLPPEDEEEKK